MPVAEWKPRSPSVPFPAPGHCYQSCIMRANTYSSPTSICSGSNLHMVIQEILPNRMSTGCQFGKPLNCTLPAPKTQITFHSHHSLISTETSQMLFKYVPRSDFPKKNCYKNHQHKIKRMGPVPSPESNLWGAFRVGGVTGATQPIGDPTRIAHHYSTIRGDAQDVLLSSHWCPLQELTAFFNALLYHWSEGHFKAKIAIRLWI